MFEKINLSTTNVPNSAETIRLLQEKITRAQKGALDVITDANFLERYADMCEAEFVPVPPKDVDITALKNMEERILQATARVDTITDFQLLLQQIPDLDPAQCADMVEHENAHANVAQQKNETTTFIGYGIVFFKDGDRIVSVQPITITDRIEGTDIIQFLHDKKEILNAPNEYGHHTSEDDNREHKNIENILAQYRDTSG